MRFSWKKNESESNFTLCGLKKNYIFKSTDVEHLQRGMSELSPEVFGLQPSPDLGKLSYFTFMDERAPVRIIPCS